MIGFDTNLLLRILPRDDAAQFARLEKQLAHGSAVGARAFVSLAAFPECFFVLVRIRKLPKADVCAAMRKVLDAAAFLIEHSEALHQALGDWEQGQAGFNDYLIGARSITAPAAALRAPSIKSYCRNDQDVIALLERDG